MRKKKKKRALCSFTPIGLRTGTVFKFGIYCDYPRDPWESSARGRGMRSWPFVPCRGHYTGCRLGRWGPGTLSPVGKRNCPCFFCFQQCLWRLAKNFYVCYSRSCVTIHEPPDEAPRCRTACTANPIDSPVWVISWWLSETTPFWICGFQGALKEASVQWCDFGPCWALANLELWAQ